MTKEGDRKKKTEQKKDPSVGTSRKETEETEKKKGKKKKKTERPKCRHIAANEQHESMEKAPVPVREHIL